VDGCVPTLIVFFKVSIDQTGDVFMGTPLIVTVVTTGDLSGLENGVIVTFFTPGVQNVFLT
jgi:hypothetical protein